MFIHTCLEAVPVKDRISTIVFEGNKEMFYGWFQYKSTKNILYMFKVDVVFDYKHQSVHVHLVLDGLKNEYTNMIEQFMEALHTIYKNECQGDVLFTIEKTYRKKEVLLEFFHMKK